MRPPPASGRAASLHTASPMLRRLGRCLGARRAAGPAPAAASLSTSATADLWADVTAVAARAREAGAIFKTDTSARLLDDGGWRFVLRVATALRAKDEHGKTRDGGGPRKKPYVNPFLPPDPRLVVCPLPPTHTLLLNKFNVADGHVLVVTRDFEAQEAPLTPADAAATWAVLAAAPGPGGGLAYFNRGPESGASQPHKHMQIVPLPLVEGRGGGGGARAPFEASALAAVAAAPPLHIQPVRSLPVRAFAAAMPAEAPDACALAACFADLAAACGVAGPDDATTSYNLLLTARVAFAVPRRAAKVGPVGVNAVGFAGSLLVRSEDELEYIESRGPWAVLRDAGVPW